MKWPEELMLIRHAQSEYNALKDKKKNDPVYIKFLELWNRDPDSQEAKDLAKEVQGKFALDYSDYETPLSSLGKGQALRTGSDLRKLREPDIIYVSPYRRAKETLELIIQGWPELKEVKIIEEERIREQEHGLSLLYNDWRVFHVLHPEQRHLFKLEGPYWYRYPQGENVADVRFRNLSWLSTLTREFSGKRMMAITHHLNILATRSNLERLSVEEFIRLDKEEKPLNCGVTLYKGYPGLGKEGHLKLGFYNRQYPYTAR